MLRSRSSMRNNLILIMLLSITFASAADYYDMIPTDGLTYRPSPFYNYDYDYDADSKTTDISPTTLRETTQRPLVRAWNNLVRNVRRNIPRISWNVTNPLTNLFNNGQSHVMEPLKTNLNSTTNSNKKRNKKRKNPNKDKQHKQPQTVEISELPQVDQSTSGAKDMYYIDPITHEYYVIKRVSSSSLKPMKEEVPTESANIVENLSSTSLKPNNVQLTTESASIQEHVSSSSLKPNNVQLSTESDNIQEHVSSSSSLKPNNVKLTVESDSIQDNKVQLSAESSNIVEPAEEQLLQADLIKPDEDVQVVEQIVDTPDELSIEHELKPMAIVDHQISADSFRNYIGSYMRDDQLSKRRQQVAYPLREKLARQRPRKVLYILREW